MSAFDPKRSFAPDLNLQYAGRVPLESADGGIGRMAGHGVADTRALAGLDLGSNGNTSVVSEK